MLNYSVLNFKIPMEDKKEIKNCPFARCKGKAVLVKNPWGQYVECKVCGANGPQFDTGESEKTVIKAWNERV